MQYTIRISQEASRDIKRYKKRSPEVYKKVLNVFDIMLETPFSNTLKTHRVKTSKHGSSYSTRVTGDIRVLWKLEKKDIDIVAIGGHSGKHTVYICL
jgi:mRNA-degrading endonuclease YafQ of YafQ-DinJ toxin-antitoxin module